MTLTNMLLMHATLETQSKKKFKIQMKNIFRTSFSMFDPKS